MHIKYKNKGLEKVCTIANDAVKKHGSKMADAIHLRIDQIRSFETVEMLIQFKIGRCHPLTGDRKDEYAMDLIHPYRLIFEKIEEQIQVVRIIDITDYH